MHIEPFAVELWMNAWENECEYNLAETCVESLTVAQLLDLCGKDRSELDAILDLKLTYGAIEGSNRLRGAIAALYGRQEAANAIVTHGTIGANMLVHKTLVSRDDRVISVVPTYQQHYSIPASIGAEVRHLRLRAENGFLPDLDDLRALAADGVRLIAINNPNNPTGAVMDRQMLLDIVEVARAHDAWLLCDEVYRGTNQTGDGVSPSIADLYEKGISTAGVSKAFSLAGLRLGWVVGPRSLIERVIIHRDYDTISVGMIDDHLATIALEHADRVLERSRTITRRNLVLLSDWVDSEPKITWQKPCGGTTALLRYDADMPSRELCEALLKETGVLLTPGSAFDMEGHLRIGYANGTEVLEAGLERISAFVRKNLD